MFQHIPTYLDCHATSVQFSYIVRGWCYILAIVIKNSQRIWDNLPTPWAVQPLLKIKKIHRNALYLWNRRQTLYHYCGEWPSSSNRMGQLESLMSFTTSTIQRPCRMRTDSTWPRWVQLVLIVIIFFKFVERVRSSFFQFIKFFSCLNFKFIKFDRCFLFQLCRLDLCFVK